MQKDKDQASGPFLFSAAALGDLEACGEDKGTFWRELFGGEGSEFKLQCVTRDAHN